MRADAKTRRLCGAALAAIERLHLLKNGDEHGGYILQEVLRLCVFEERGVLLQFVRDLINDETAPRRERIVGFLQKGAFLVDLKDAEWNLQ